MLDYILHFYNSYTFFFYLLLIVWVVAEWPIIILGLSLISYKIWFGFYELLFFAFLWDFLWDLLLFLIWKYFSKKFKNKDFSLIKKLNKKLKYHKLLDKLIVIKYTPPITSLGLIYLGFSGISLKKFIKNNIILNIFSSFLITILWYSFW